MNKKKEKAFSQREGTNGVSIDRYIFSSSTELIGKGTSDSDVVFFSLYILAAILTLANLVFQASALGLHFEGERKGK